VDPDGDRGWDLDIQVPDDARELERDVIAYHRELRALKRRRMLRRIMPAQAGIMPLIASILAVCLVAGMMLSVFTISPTEGPSKTHQPAGRATTQQSVSPIQQSTSIQQNTSIQQSTSAESSPPSAPYPLRFRP
jgi:cytoskeletal protein RodZ